MKLFKFVFLVILLMGIPAFAIDYKSVYVERGDKAQVWDIEQAKDIGYFWLSAEEKKQWVVVQNHNSDPVQVTFEYKVGHRDAPWQSYESFRMEPKSESIICIGADIKGLRIVYVNVDKSETTKNILNAIGSAATLLGDSIQTKDDN